MMLSKRHKKHLSSFELIQVLQPCQNNLFACFFNFTREKDFVEDSVDLESHQ
jgi:hypothetical protein